MPEGHGRYYKSIPLNVGEYSTLFENESIIDINYPDLLALDLG